MEKLRLENERIVKEAEQTLEADKRDGVINPEKRSLELIVKLANNLNMCLDVFIKRGKG